MAYLPENSPIVCHCEPFAFCHSEPKAKNLFYAQGKLRVAIPCPTEIASTDGSQPTKTAKSHSEPKAKNLIDLREWVH